MALEVRRCFPNGWRKKKCKNLLRCPHSQSFKDLSADLKNKISVVSTFFAILLVWISKPKTCQPPKAY
jgi:hypothetical protein